MTITMLNSCVREKCRAWEERRDQRVCNDEMITILPLARHYCSASTGVLLYLLPGRLLGSHGVIRGQELLKLRDQAASPGP